MIYILPRRTLVMVNVLYYMPDYRHIVQKFYWETEDIVPDIPRVHRFLNYWHKEIDAVISDIEISY